MRARVARIGGVEVISKVERTAVRRSLHRLVRWLASYRGPRMSRLSNPRTDLVESGVESKAHLTARNDLVENEPISGARRCPADRSAEQSGVDGNCPVRGCNPNLIRV